MRCEIHQRRLVLNSLPIQENMKMTDDVKLRNKWLSALLPALVVLMLAACSSTDEAAQPEDTGGVADTTQQQR